MRRIYPSSSSLANVFHDQVKLNDDSGNQVADALWDYGRRVIIAEIKATWIKDEALLSSNPEDYIEEVRKKLVSGDRMKGPAQLARIINQLLTKGIDFNPSSNISSIETIEVIIPVLIVYDQLMGSTFDPILLRQEFEQQLVPDERYENGYMRKGGRIILPFLTLTIDEVEFVEALEGQVSFGDLLFDYASNLHDQYLPLSAYISSRPELKPRQQGYLSNQFIELVEKLGVIQIMKDVRDRLQTKEEEDIIADEEG
ncbi:MAG: hypothetical protein ACYDCO_05815 [Armatimonadota bacterium]